MSWASTASQRPARDGTSQRCADGCRAWAQRHPRGVAHRRRPCSSSASRSTRWPPVSTRTSGPGSRHGPACRAERAASGRGEHGPRLGRVGSGYARHQRRRPELERQRHVGHGGEHRGERQRALAREQAAVQRLVAQRVAVASGRLGRRVGDLQVGQQRGGDSRGGRRASRPSGPGAACRRARRRWDGRPPRRRRRRRRACRSVKIGRNSSTTTTPAGRGPLAQLAEALDHRSSRRPGHWPRARGARRARRRCRRARRRDRGRGRGSPARCRAAMIPVGAQPPARRPSSSPASTSPGRTRCRRRRSPAAAATSTVPRPGRRRARCRRPATPAASVTSAPVRRRPSPSTACAAPAC